MQSRDLCPNSATVHRHVTSPCSHVPKYCDASLTLNGRLGVEREHKVFQINAPSTFKVSSFTARDAGKFIRQNGDTTCKVVVEIDKCDISRMDDAIFGTDSNSSTVMMTNTRYSMIGDQLFVGVNQPNITQSNNKEY